MSIAKIKKIILIGLFFGQFGLPILAFAQLGVLVNTPASPLWVNTAVNPLTDAIPLASVKAASVANQSCATSEAAFGVADTGTQFGLGGLSLISGGSSLQIQLMAKVAKIDGFITCRQGVLISLDLIPTLDTLIGQQKQTVYSSASGAINSLKTKEESVKAQLANAQQGFWKTLVFNILIQTTKSVADALVTKLVNNYKITNVKQYADSVATLMYDNQYLRDNFPDAQGQLMARAILNQPELRNQIQPGIFVAANAALGFTPSTLSPSDPNYYQKMAMVGSSAANPYFLQASYVSKTDQAHAQALAQANAQIAQSQGFKTPVNCAGSLAQQKQIDAQSKAASDQLANRQALLASLQAAGPAASQSDLAKAQADYNKALLAWNNVPFAVTGSSSVSSLQQGGGNNTEGTMAIAMCEAISSPATLINQGIDAVVNHYTDGLSQYNSNNLPAYITLISQVASQIGSSLIFGGTSAAKSAALANENILANGAVTTVNQTLSANGTISAPITFVIVPNSGSNTANTYQANWNVDSTAFPTVDHVTIVGDGIQQTIKSASGSTSITTTKGGNYTLTVYDSNGNTIASSSTTVNPNSTSPSIGASGSSAQPSGSITITPPYGTVAAGGNIAISCSNLFPPGSYQVIVQVNGVSIPQAILISNGVCTANVAVTAANNFNSNDNNNIYVFVGAPNSTSPVSGTPTVTTLLFVTGTVLGASTSQPVLESRGPAVFITPRGQ